MCKAIHCIVYNVYYTIQYIIYDIMYSVQCIIYYTTYTIHYNYKLLGINDVKSTIYNEQYRV